jgi:hypothetical protein
MRTLQIPKPLRPEAKEKVIIRFANGETPYLPVKDAQEAGYISYALDPQGNVSEIVAHEDSQVISVAVYCPWIPFQG